MAIDLQGFSSAIAQRKRVRDVAALETDFAAFFRAAWPVLEPSAHLVWGWHHQLKAEWLQFISAGEFKRRCPDLLGVIFNEPPRSLKSLMITVAWPVWDWLQHPERRFVMASYASSLAADHSIKRQTLIDSAWFQQRWGTRFRWGNRKQIETCENDRTGCFVATSVNAVMTGIGGDVLISDDLLKASDSYSAPAREAANRWQRDSYSVHRLNDPRTGVLVHCSQRLCEDDPSGHLLKTYPGKFVHVVIPREAEEDTDFEFPISGHIFHRPKGDVLDPERCPPAVLAELKAHSREWSGQQQQKPVPDSGVIFNPDWWRYYRSTDPLPTFDLVAISVDCAFKATSQSDFVSLQKWASIGPRNYLLECRTERLGYTSTKAAIKAMNNRGRRPSVVLIEDRANGSAVIEELKREDLGASVIPVNPMDGKVARAYAASADCEAGNVYLPEDAPWLSDFLYTAANFPGVRNDDVIDACTQYLNWRRARSPRFGLLEWYEQKRQRELEEERLGLVGAREVYSCVNPETGQKLEWDPDEGVWRDSKTRAPYVEGEQ